MVRVAPQGGEPGSEDLRFLERVAAVGAQLLLHGVEDLVRLCLLLQLVYQDILGLDLLDLFRHLLPRFGSLPLCPLVVPVRFLGCLLPELHIAPHLALDLLELGPPGRVFAEHVIHLEEFGVFAGQLGLKVCDGGIGDV